MARNRRKGKKPKNLAKIGRRPGRPGTYAVVCNHIARKVCELGATDKELAGVLGISCKTLYEWKLHHPSFARAVKLGKEVPDERVRRSLYNRAVGYDFEEEQLFYNSGKDKVHRETVTKHVPPDVRAQQHWLTHREPYNWGPRSLGGEADGTTAPSLASAQDMLIARLFGIATRMRPQEPRVIESRAVEVAEPDRQGTD